MTDPKTNLTHDDVIAIKVRVETAIYATNEALKVAAVDPREQPGRTMNDRLAEALFILRSTVTHCDRILFDNPRERRMTMTEQEFIASMRVLFRVWRGTENADDILTDVVATIGSQCFEKHGLELRALEAKCGSQMRAQYLEERYPPPALKLEMERDLKGAVAMGKVWGEVFDNLFSPKAK